MKNTGIKSLLFIPIGLGGVLWLIGVSTSFGADFYTYVYRGIYFGAGCICFSIGIVGALIYLCIEKIAVGNVDSKKETVKPNITASSVAAKTVKTETTEPRRDVLEEQRRVTEEHMKAKELLDAGIITEEEYRDLIS